MSAGGASVSPGTAPVGSAVSGPGGMPGSQGKTRFVPSMFSSDSVGIDPCMANQTSGRVLMYQILRNDTVTKTSRVIYV